MSRTSARPSRIGQIRARRHQAVDLWLHCERLEGRVLLSGYFDTLAEHVAGSGGAMASITGALQNVGSVAERLPLIDKPARSITQITNALEDFRPQLYNTLRSLGPSSTAAAIQSAIYAALGPGGANVLADKTGNGLDQNDVVVVADGAAGVDISIDVGKSTSFSSALGLGIDAVPFKPTDAASGGFTIGLVYRNFDFGFRNNSPYFKTAAADELRFGITGRLPAPPASFRAGLGFINFEASDGTPGVDDLSLNLTADVTPSFGLANARLDGALNLLLKLGASLGGTGLPSFKTDFRLNWQFPTVALGGVSAGAAGSAESRPFGLPALRLENVQMNLGSLLGGVVSPIADKVRFILEPFQPIFDIVQQRVPGLSDLSEAMGGPRMTLASLSTLMSSIPGGVLPPGLHNVIRTTEKLREFSELANDLAGEGGNGWLQIGSFDIAGPNGSSLLDTAAAALGNLGLDNWSSLVFGPGGVDFNGIKNQIVGLLGSDVGSRVNSMWQGLNDSTQGNGVFFRFPVVEEPTTVALKTLLGQDAELVHLTARLNLNFDKFFPLVPLPLVTVGIRANAHLNALAEIGYDMRGLRDAIAPLYGGGSFQAQRLLNGIYVDPNTAARTSGGVALELQIGLPDVISIAPGGGLTANAEAVIANPFGRDKIRPFKGDLTHCLMELSGEVYASAFIHVKAGFEVLGAWIGIDEKWEFARGNLLKFDVDCAPMPQELTAASVPPVELARYDAPTRTLTLAMGPNAGWRNDPQIAAVINEHFTVSRVFFPRSFGGTSITIIESLQVSAFGVTKRYDGPIDRVIAIGGSGDDSVVVRDWSDNAPQYVLTGDDGNDRLIVEGELTVTLQGGNGNDTLDGGNGKGNVLLAGQGGFDTLIIGDGLVQNLNPSAVFNLDGGAQGAALLLDNSRSTASTSYVIVNEGQSNAGPWLLNIGGPGPGRQVRFASLDLKLFSGSGHDTFGGYFPPRSSLYGGGGNDLLDVTYHTGGNALPLYPSGYNFSFFGGDGFDTVPLHNHGHPADVPIYVYRSAVQWGTTYQQGVHVRDVENVDIRQKPTAMLYVAGWDEQTMSIDGGLALQVFSGNYWGWDSYINARNVPSVYVENSNDPNALGQFVVNASGGADYGELQKLLPSGRKLRIGYGATTSEVGVFGGGNGTTRVTVDPAIGTIGRPMHVLFGGYFGKPSELIVNGVSSSAPYDFEINGGQVRTGQLTLDGNNLTSLQVIGTQFDDNVLVKATTVPTEIVPVTGNNTITFDGAALRAAAPANGGTNAAVTVSGTGGNDRLIIDDAAFDNGEYAFGSAFVEQSGRLPNVHLIDLTDVTATDIFLLTGAGDDRVRVNVVAPRNRLFIDGDAGDDLLFVGHGPHLTGNVRGRIEFDGGPGANAAYVSDALRTGEGVIAHVDGSLVGAHADDTLFGPGGSLRVSDEVGVLEIDFGRGADQVYVTPDDVTAITLRGNDPPVGPDPGDTLFLLFLGATDPVFTPDADGDGGQYTFSNRAPVTYAGFEQTDADTVAPVVTFGTVTTVQHAGLVRHVVRFGFSEDVIGLQPSVLTLENLTTSTQVPTDQISVSWNGATKTADFTLTTPDGRLPDGRYRATLSPAVTDTSGNPLASPAAFAFFVSTGSDSAADRYVLRAGAGATVEIFKNTDPVGAPTFIVPHGDLARMLIETRGGDDEIVLDLSAGWPLTEGNAVSLLDAGAGHDRLVITGAAPGDAITISGASVTRELDFLEHAAVESFALATGTFTLDSTWGAAAANQLGLELGADATALTTPNRKRTMLLSTLAISESASLDLLNNDLVVDYSSVSPAQTWNGSAYDGVTGLIASGRIITSSGSGTYTTLGVAEARDVLGITGTQTATWSGHVVDATTVLVKFTYGGDANLDGVLNIDDYGQIDFNVGLSGLVFGYYNGDFNLDGLINIDDYGIIDFNVGIQGPQLGDEPAVKSKDGFAGTIPTPLERDRVLWKQDAGDVVAWEEDEVDSLLVKIT